MWQETQAFPSSQGGSRDKANMEVAHKEERPWLFWMSVEGLRQGLGDGRENFYSDVVIVPTL
jgi:hypothetical protein